MEQLSRKALIIVQDQRVVSCQIRMTDPSSLGQEQMFLTCWLYFSPMFVSFITLTIVNIYFYFTFNLPSQEFNLFLKRDYIFLVPYYKFLAHTSLSIIYIKWVTKQENIVWYVVYIHSEYNRPEKGWRISQPGQLDYPKILLLNKCWNFGSWVDTFIASMIQTFIWNYYKSPF